MFRKFTVIFISTIVILTTLCSSTYAYNLLGGKQRTTDLRVIIKDSLYYKLADSGTHYVGLIQQSVSDWENSTEVLSWEIILGAGGDMYFGGDDYGNIGWNARCTNYREYIWFGNYTSSILDLNFYNMDSRIDSYNKSTISHEIGHALGLDHVDSTNQIMHTYGNPTRTVTTPQWDDIAGVVFLYQ